MLENGEFDDLINSKAVAMAISGDVVEGKEFFAVKQLIEDLNWNLTEVNTKLGLYGSNHIIFTISANPVLNDMFRKKISD